MGGNEYRGENIEVLVLDGRIETNENKRTTNNE